MWVQRSGRLAFPLMIGTLVTITLTWLAIWQAGRVSAGISLEHSPVVLYVSTLGQDAENDCQQPGSPCHSIPRALQVAQDGDYIHVAGGTYRDTMYDPDIAMGVTATVIITKQVSSLLGGYTADFSTRDVQANETILSAAGSPGAHVAVLVETSLRFGGFTLTGGSGAYSPGGYYYPGGAMRVFGGEPTILDNKIIGNLGYRRGGGIYLGRGAQAIIIHNQVISNTVTAVDGDDISGGGGIFVASGPTLIQENLVLSNTAQLEGGGIYIGWNVPVTVNGNTIAYNQLLSPWNSLGAGLRVIGENVVVTIQGNTFHHNSLSGGYEGSAIYTSSPARIDGNRIQENFAPSGHSAVCVANVSAPVTLTNNLVIDNTGIGVRFIDNYDVRMINNTIAGNDPRGVQVSFPVPSALPPDSFNLFNNLVVDNGECGVFIENQGWQRMDYNDVSGHTYQYCGFPHILEHNLSLDPSFVNPASSNYHLLAGSPVIDQGDVALATLTDYDGSLRGQNNLPDMGAYEFVYLKLYLPVLQRDSSTVK
jgi:hypothetical protein